MLKINTKDESDCCLELIDFLINCDSEPNTFYGQLLSLLTDVEIEYEKGKDNKYDKSHGSPYDRGSADAYYGRQKDPHKYPNGTYNAPRIVLTDSLELEAYEAGYNEQPDRKEYE